MLREICVPAGGPWLSVSRWCPLVVNWDIRRGNKHSDVVRERERYSELWWKVAVPDALSFKKSCSGARNAEAGTN